MCQTANLATEDIWLTGRFLRSFAYGIPYLYGNMQQNILQCSIS